MTQRLSRHARGPITIHAVLQRAGAAHPPPSRVIDRGPPSRREGGVAPSPDVPALELALREDGVATVASDGTTGLRVLRSSRAGRFTPAEAVSRRSHFNLSLATAHDGRTLLSWTAGRRGRIYTRLRAARSPRFGPTTPVPRSAGASSAQRSTFDPSSGRPAVLWFTRLATHVAIRR